MKSNDKFNWIPAELLWDAYINMSTDNMTDFIQFYFFLFHYCKCHYWWPLVKCSCKVRAAFDASELCMAIPTERC